MNLRSLDTLALTAHDIYQAISTNWSIYDLRQVSGNFDLSITLELRFITSIGSVIKEIYVG